MVELRQRVLKSGNLILEYRKHEPVWVGTWFPRLTGYKWTEWQMVPYVDEAGEPLKTEYIDGALYIHEHA